MGDARPPDAGRAEAGAGTSEWARDATRRLRSALSGTAFDRIDWVAETGSTNADLLARAKAGEAGPAVLIAEAQTAGRGRMGRSWQAPAGSGLMVSVLVRPTIAASQAHLITTAMGLAALESLELEADRRTSVGLKWPNDLVVESEVGTRKLGGILAESILVGERLEAVVVGIGLNVNWPGELPSELEGIATSLGHLIGGVVDRVALAERVLLAFDVRASSLGSPDGRARLVSDYVEACVTVGRRVLVQRPAGDLEGRAEAIDSEGRLVVVDGGGARHVVAVGDVTHLRPLD